MSDPQSLAAMLMLGPREVAALVSDVPPHVDDFPDVEYGSGRLLDRDGSWLDNMRVLWAARATNDPFAALPGGFDGARGTRATPHRPARASGALAAVRRGGRGRASRRRCAAQVNDRGAGEGRRSRAPSGGRSRRERGDRVQPRRADRPDRGGLLRPRTPRAAPRRRAAITGHPHAIASSAGRPKPSLREGTSSARAPRYRSTSSASVGFGHHCTSGSSSALDRSRGRPSEPAITSGGSTRGRQRRPGPRSAGRGSCGGRRRRRTADGAAARASAPARTSHRLPGGRPPPSPSGTRVTRSSSARRVLRDGVDRGRAHEGAGRHPRTPALPPLRGRREAERRRVVERGDGRDRDAARDAPGREVQDVEAVAPEA